MVDVNSKKRSRSKTPGPHDYRACNNGNPADCGWTLTWRQRLAWWPLRFTEHHPFFNKRCKSCGQMPSGSQWETHRHGLPHSHTRCIRCRLDMSLGETRKV